MNASAAAVTKRPRVHIFIDFWNFQLELKKIENGFGADFKILGPILAAAAMEQIDKGTQPEFAGLNVYISTNTASQSWAWRPGAAARVRSRHGRWRISGWLERGASSQHGARTEGDVTAGWLIIALRGGHWTRRDDSAGFSFGHQVAADAYAWELPPTRLSLNEFELVSKGS